MNLEELITEIVGEAVKNAVDEALAPFRTQLDAIKEMVKEIKADVGTNECKCVDVNDITGPILDAIEQDNRDRNLEQGRAELRQARLIGRAS